MTIAEVREKCKKAIERIPRDVLAVSLIMFASFASFGLGYLAGLDAGQGSVVKLSVSPDLATSTPGEVVASKTGMTYYPPDCNAAERISDANKIYFTSERAAEAAGYARAANCSGF